MEYNSFYGGRKGASFVIVNRYKTITEMINYFKQGSNYKTVNFDEYVIIDTENKNDKDNGKVYRRGYDYNNAQGGAEYIGQIVGASGPAPMVEGKKISEIENIVKTSGFDYRTSSGEFNATEGLVPGKDVNGKYNDKIIYKACSVRDKNSLESSVYIGFSFPYTVIDFTAELTDMTNINVNNIISRVDNKEHPYYEQWKIKVPIGTGAIVGKESDAKVLAAAKAMAPYSA